MERFPSKSRHRLVLVCIAVCALATPAMALAADAAPTPHVHHRLKDLNELQGYVTQDREEIARETTPPSRTLRNDRLTFNSVLQNLAIALANVSEATAAIRAVDEGIQSFNQVNGQELQGNEHADLQAIDDAHAEDAVKAIAQAARSRQVVILNEAHHVAYDRMFAMHLARALRKEGFQYLACETFLTGDTHVMQAGYVSERTGIYSVEPMFAKFLRDAHQDGWKFVSYEPDAAAGPRESGMAKLLIQQILAKDPKARIFIYAGYHHAMKVPVSTADDDDSRLAAQWLRLTGIDPLTIDQTTLYAHDDDSRQALLYRHAVRKLTSSQPAVLVGANGKPVKLGYSQFAYDYEVVHPDDGIDPATRRPQWLSGEFTAFDIPRELLPTDHQRVIYAYAKGAPADAVPLDVILLKPGHRAPKMMLPPGDYTFEYED